MPCAASRVKNVPNAAFSVVQLPGVTGLAGAERARAVEVVVQVGEVGEGDRDAVRLHVQGVGERVDPGHAVVAGEPDVAAGVLDDLAVQVADRPGRADHRLEELAPVQRAVAVVAAGLVGQHVGPRPGRRRRPSPRAQCTARPMKSAVALLCRFGFAASLASGEFAPNTWGTSGSVFSSSVFALRDRAEVAAGPGVGDPRGGRGAPVRADHRRGVVADRLGRQARVVVHDRVGPVGERARRVRGAVGLVVVVLVRDRDALAAAVQAALRA